jgi:phage protein D/phage baseplate assembly protein gpV
MWSLAQFIVKLNGSTAPESMMQVMEEVIVETNFHLPAMFSFRPVDRELEWMDSSQLAVGTEVEIQVQAAEESRPTKIFSGEITALEPSFDIASPSMQVRGYDKGHRLHLGRQRRVFLQVKDSDIARQLAGEAGLSADVDDTPEVYEHVIQSNLTNWEFLQERARRVGYDCYVKDDKLHFKRLDTSGSAAVEFQWGDNLSRFIPRLSTSGQVTEVEVRGWDPTTKSEIVGTANPRTEAQPDVGVGGVGGDVTESAFGTGAKMVVVDRPVHSEGEADKMAQAIADDLGGAFVRADGEAEGNPLLRAGQKVTISNLGNRFSGDYYVTRATHYYTGGEGYKVRFSVTGRRPLSIGSVLAGRPGLPDARMPGVVTAIVTNIQDPDNQGRVKVKFPWFSDDIESTWARVSVPMAGAERGIFYLPEVDDEVLVAFEHNDINFPYLLGALWNGQDAPPEADSGDVIGSGGQVQQRVFKTRDGHLIVFEDSPGGKPGIRVIDKTGNNQVLIDSTENKITLEAAGDIILQATGKVMITGDTGVEIESGTSFKASSGTDLSIEASTSATLKGSASVDVQASGQVNVKGSMVNLN